MKIIEINEIDTNLIQNLLVIWENSVKATHLSLSDNEIKNIKNYVPEAIKHIQHLILIEDGGFPVGFMV